MSEENKYILQVKDLHTSFATDAGEVRAVNGVSFNLEPGKTLGIVGESGSGKTTILRMLAGLETADSGDILIDGNVVNDVPASKRGIGFVFQSYALFPSGTKSRCRSSEGKSARSFSRIR